MLVRQRTDCGEQQEQLAGGGDSTAGGPLLLEKLSGHGLQLSLTSRGWGVRVARGEVLARCELLCS